MRIIAGTYRGRILTSPRDHSVRPTTDRVKQTLFDILSNRIYFENLTVLDLFCGTGSLGLEAISRGAASVTFVDNSFDSLALLRKNIAALGCDSQCMPYQAEVFWFLKNMKKQYDLVFVDPPYKLETIGKLPTALHESGILKEGSIAAMEHSRESSISIPDGVFDAVRKPFGQTTLLILHYLGKTDRATHSPLDREQT
jgi:16S rRNA (guanine966-N2)-methyltransferase